MLASTTLGAMLSRRSELEVAVVPDQGHAPLLTEPKLIGGLQLLSHRATSLPGSDVGTAASSPCALLNSSSAS
jgi:hypothetical protein